MVVVDGGYRQVSQHVVAGERNLLAGKHLDTFQQHQFGAGLDAHQGCHFVGDGGFCRTIEGAVAEVQQDHFLMADVCPFAIGAADDSRWVYIDLSCDILNVRLAELPGKKFVPRPEIPNHHQETDFVGGCPQVQQ